jgi:hypothetical protein
MALGRNHHGKSNLRQTQKRNSAVGAKQRRPGRAGRAQVGHFVAREPFAPPEDWHEPTGREDYKFVVQPPGEGYRHVLSPADIRARLSLLPKRFTEQLEVVQLSRITRKKLSFPCYGMQWGNALYLYPVEESLVETFSEPPRPAVVNEARMYGGQWAHPEPDLWTLTWTEETIRDFYLNNILIHELGHLLDERNSSYVARERYAEWFAIEYGYRTTGGGSARRPNQPILRRHHG